MSILSRGAKGADHPPCLPTPQEPASSSTTSPASPPSKRFSKRRKARSALRRARSIAVKHTWVLPLAILLVFLVLFVVNPTESNPIHHFIFLSYRLPDSEQPAGELPQYGKGLWDIAFVSFYTVVLSFTREFIMQEILRPMARWSGLRSRGKQARYMEQMYTALYFGILGPTGMYVMSRTPVWYFNTRAMYEAFPHKTHDALFKFYYLFQAAYWAQQAIVLLLGMEKPRKDFKELVGHHIVSLALIGLSYRFHFTYMGLAVYITHDISDFFLAVCPLPPPSLPLTTDLPRVDLQNPQLPRPLAHSPLLHHLRLRLDLPAALPQPAHPAQPLHRVQDRRPLRAQLGDAAVQVHAVLRHHAGPAQLATGAQPVLAVLHPADRVPLCGAQCRQG